jgi:phosphohistidine phosphatase
MEIYLLRHGIAEDQTPTQQDSHRALTKEGITRLQEVLATVAKAGSSPQLILSSPYVRARQTADIARQILKVEADIVETQALVPMAQPREAWDDIRALRSESSILLASHEPLMGQLLAFLLSVPGLQLDFKKGAIARVDLHSFGPAPRGVLKWFLTAKLGRS